MITVSLIYISTGDFQKLSVLSIGISVSSRPISCTALKVINFEENPLILLNVLSSSERNI